MILTKASLSRTNSNSVNVRELICDLAFTLNALLNRPWVNSVKMYELHTPTIPEEACTDPLINLFRYRGWIEKQTGQVSRPEHYLFPGMSGENYNVGMPMSDKKWENLFKKYTDASGLANRYKNSQFSGHSMRRGAAQWRFNLSPNNRWSIAVIKWWGGWDRESVSRPNFSDLG